MCGDDDDHDHATSALEAEGREEPPVLAGEVTLLEHVTRNMCFDSSGLFGLFLFVVSPCGGARWRVADTATS
jgi:hypothetical protein